MDSASIFAARSLRLPSEGRILDACAAPGGKSLVLASLMGSRPVTGAGLSLVANELSADRRRRLRDVLDRHLPRELRARVLLTGRDAAAMCRSYQDAFDAILLDAPCSSERHVLSQAGARSGGGGRGDGAALVEWSPARIRGLAARQWALLVLGPHHAQERPLPRLLDLRPVARGKRRRRSEGPGQVSRRGWRVFPALRQALIRRTGGTGRGGGDRVRDLDIAGQKRGRRPDVYLQDMEGGPIELRRLYPGNLEESRPKPR